MADHEGTVMGYPVDGQESRTRGVAVRPNTMADHEGTVMGYPVNGQESRTLGFAVRPNTTTTTTTTRTATTTTRNRPNITATTATTIDVDSHRDNIAGFFLCTVLIVVVALITIVCVSLGTTHFHTQKFQVDSLTVYPFNISSSHITANWNFNFSITNPNHWSTIYYDDVEASVYYKDKILSSTRLESFLQSQDDERLVQANFTASLAYVNDTVASAMVKDWSQGHVNFTVKVKATSLTDPYTRYEIRNNMMVSCEELNVGFSSNMTTGTMLSGSRECMVHLYELP